MSSEISAAPSRGLFSSLRDFLCRTYARHPWMFAVLLLLLTLLAYAPVLFKAQYVWDDNDYLTANPLVRQPGGLAAIWFQSSQSPQYYPLVFTTFFLEYRLWGLWPAGYHLVNVLLHAGSAILVWRLLRRLKPHLAIPAALVFALHPVMVESVAWITERKNVLSGLLYLAALLAYLHFALPAAAPSLSKWKLYSLSLTLFVLALLSKSVACSLPAAILLLLWFARGGGDHPGALTRRTVLPLIPFFILGLAAGLHTAYFERVYVGAVGPDWNFSFLERILIAGRAFWFYIAKLLFPAPLIFIYPRWTINTGAAWQYLFPLAALGAVAAALLLTRRLGRGPAACILFFTLTIAPALGLSNTFPMKFSFVADHFQYLASLGIIVLVVGAAAPLAARFRAPALSATLFVLLLALLSFLTAHRGLAFQDAESLWTDTLRKNDRAWVAMDNLATILQRRRQFNEALLLLLRSREIKPANHVEVYLNLGSTYVSLQQPAPARQAFQECTKQNGDPWFRASATVGLGTLAFHEGDLDGALKLFRQSVEIYPRLVLGYDDISAVLLALARPAEARAAAEKALSIDPNDAPARQFLQRAKAALSSATHPSTASP